MKKGTVITILGFSNVLKLHPFLIKPNNHELGEIFGVELSTRDSVILYARKLQEIMMVLKENFSTVLPG